METTSDLERALKIAESRTSRDGTRWFPSVVVPGEASLSQVFGEEGVLYWAKSWEWAEDQVEEEGFVLDLRVKPEYCKDLFEALFQLGGSVVVSKAFRAKGAKR